MRQWKSGDRYGHAPTSNGSQFFHSAHDRIIKRNPTANTKERRMTAAHEKESVATRQS